MRNRVAVGPFWGLVALTFATALPCAAQGKVEVAPFAGGTLAQVDGRSLPGFDPLPPIDTTQLVSHAETLATPAYHDSAGDVVVLGLRVAGDSAFGLIDAFTHGSRLTQHVDEMFYPRSLGVAMVRDSTSNPTVSLTYSPYGVRGTLVTTNALGEHETLQLDRPTGSMILNRRHLLTVVPWLSLGTGSSYRLWIHDDFVQTILPIRVTVAERLHLSVPAGAFDVYRVDLIAEHPRKVCAANRLFPTVLYITADSPRRIVRIERPGRKWIAELTHGAEVATP